MRNRRGLGDVICAHLNVALLGYDLDNFKQVNDRYVPDRPTLRPGPDIASTAHFHATSRAVCWLSTALTGGAGYIDSQPSFLPRRCAKPAHVDERSPQNGVDALRKGRSARAFTEG